MKRGTLLILTIALIFAAVLPWGDFQGHTHWAKVGWIPFFSKPVRIRDVLANVVLFVPFGAAAGRVLRHRYTVVLVTVGGAAISLVGEAAQLYSHTRFPSATDLVCNTLGAAVGAALVSGRFRSSPGR